MSKSQDPHALSYGNSTGPPSDPLDVKNMELQDAPPLMQMLLQQLASILGPVLEQAPGSLALMPPQPVLLWLHQTLSLAEQSQTLRLRCQPLYHLCEQIQHHLAHLHDQMLALATRSQQEATPKTMRDGLLMLQAHLQRTLKDCQQLQRYLQELRHQHNKDTNTDFQHTLQHLLLEAPPTTEPDPALLQSRLLEVVREAFLGQLTRYVIHDLGSPASYMLSNLSAATVQLEHLFADQDAQTQPWRDPVLWEELLTIHEDTREGVMRLRDILQEMDNWQRDGDGSHKALLSVEELVRLALRITREDYTEALVELEPGLMVYGDRGQLSQILVNLIQNATCAQARSGRPLVIELRALGRNKTVCLEVSNQGPAIPPALQERIFEPFFTTCPKQHSGLGLVISRTLAERHGGSLKVHSDERRTTFTLRLPRRHT